jgi:ATP-dependent DNA ligase
VSGFTDAQLEDFNSRRSELIGEIMEVEANDMTKSTGNEFHALSHPRFIQLRSQKETDTIERVRESIEMAKELK